jgi:NADPH-dependent curcumin reductase CurA
MFRIPRKVPVLKSAFYLPLYNNWFVAYAGICMVGKIKKGETVLVSSAAGATGIICV